MHLVRLLALAPALFSGLAPALVAQSRKFTEVVVLTAGADEMVAGMPSYQKAIAQGLDGNWWIALVRVPKAADGAFGAATAELWKSTDGMHWEKGAEVPKPGSGSVSVVADPSVPQLHVLWSTATKDGWGEPWYQAYDLATANVAANGDGLDEDGVRVGERHHE